MRCIKEKTIEEIIKGEELRIEGLNINDEEYSLNVVNKRKDQISLEFNKAKHPNEFSVPEYTIIINEKGIRFERFVSRPNHDHNDVQTLIIRAYDRIKKEDMYDPEDPNQKLAVMRWDETEKEWKAEGELCWSSDGPDHGWSERSSFNFYIPFGKIVYLD